MYLLFTWKGLKKHNTYRKDHKDKSHKVEETDEKLEKKMSTTNKSSNKLPFTEIPKFVFTFYNKSLSECLIIGYRLSYNTTWSANKLNTSS